MKNRKVIAILLIAVGVIVISNELLAYKVILALPGTILVLLGMIVIIRKPIHLNGEQLDFSTEFEFETQKERISLFQFRPKMGQEYREISNYIFSRTQVEIPHQKRIEINGIFSFIKVPISYEMYEQSNVQVLFGGLFVGGERKMPFAFYSGEEEQSIFINGVFSVIVLEIQENIQ